MTMFFSSMILALFLVGTTGSAQTTPVENFENGTGFLRQAQLWEPPQGSPENVQPAACLLSGARLTDNTNLVDEHGDTVSPGSEKTDK